MAFQNAANIVIAQIFQLIDPSGVIIATLTTGTGRVEPIVSTPFGALSMLHNDPNTTDSSLRWSQNGSTGAEAFALEGPVTVGGGTQRPTVSVFRSAGPTTGVAIESGRPDGNGAVSFGSFISVTDDNTNGSIGMDCDVMSISSPPITATSPGGFLARGAIYGEQFKQLAPAGAASAVPIAGFVVSTLAPVTVPASSTGAWVDIVATVGWQVVIGGDTLTIQIQLNGIVLAPVGIDSGKAVGSFGTTTCCAKGLLVVGVNTVRVVAFVGAINGSFAVQNASTFTALNATFYL